MSRELDFVFDDENSHDSSLPLRLTERETARGPRRSAKATQRKNGFVFFSFPIFVGGPCPGSTVTSSPRGNIFFLISCNNRSISPPGKSPRPMLPANSTSPPMINRSSDKKKQRLPGQ